MNETKHNGVGLWKESLENVSGTQKQTFIAVVLVEQNTFFTQSTI